jgi:transcriptional regulator with XRE-family HTH domain
MITSAQMLKSANEEINGIRNTIGEITQKQSAGEIKPEDAARNIENLERFIAKIEHDIAEYNSLKSGSTEYINPQRLEDLPRTITQLRLHYDWPQQRLADELGIAQQQIARYEATDYEGISFQRILALLEAFDAHISIEKIKLTIDGKSQTKFLMPKGYKPEDLARKKRAGLFNMSKVA